MKTLKRIIGICAVSLIGIAVFGIWYANNILASQTQILVNAGQKALDSTILQSIQSGEIYTGGPTEYVFYGKDSIGRNVWVFVTPNSSYAELAQSGLQQDKILQIAKQLPVGITKELHAIPGMVDDQVKTQFSKAAQSKLVWEVYGKDTSGHLKYAYFDFYSGKLLWTYTLPV